MFFLKNFSCFGKGISLHTAIVSFSKGRLKKQYLYILQDAFANHSENLLGI